MNAKPPMQSTPAAQPLNIIECIACSRLFLIGESEATDARCFCSLSCERRLMGPACMGCGSTGVFFYPVYVRGVGMLPYCAPCLNSGITEAHL